MRKSAKTPRHIPPMIILALVLCLGMACGQAPGPGAKVKDMRDRAMAELDWLAKRVQSILEKESIPPGALDAVLQEYLKTRDPKQSPRVAGAVVMDSEHRLVAGREISPASPGGKPLPSVGLSFAKYDIIKKAMKKGGIQAGTFYAPGRQILSVAQPLMTKRRELLGVVAFSFDAKEMVEWGLTAEEFLAIDFN